MRPKTRKLRLACAAVCSIGLLGVTNSAMDLRASAPFMNKQRIGQQELWSEVDTNRLDPGLMQSRGSALPSKYRVVQLSRDRFFALTAHAPREEVLGKNPSPSVIELPLPGGNVQRFRFAHASILEPGLEHKYPDLKTYAGRGIEDPSATTRFDHTPSGFHAQILGTEGTVYIDPLGPGNRDLYLVYNKSDLPGGRFRCLVDSEENAERPHPDAAAAFVPNGGTLRTYRLAVAATGEYTRFHGGTVAGALGAIVTTVNRVVGIYERDLSVRLILVANNDQIIYTNASTDPFSNGSADINANTSVLNNAIGSANYDVGHVFNTGGGGVAVLRAVCSSSKARGVSGLPNPVGDGYDVDYVAHEMGHQFGGNHSFNGAAGSCSGNRNGATAYEPGSGSTIMAYAGICGVDNVQPNSDDYFHLVNLNEMVAFTSNPGTGDSCAAKTPTGNAVPTVNAGPDYTIPRGTPFTLTAAGADDDGDTLTYTWEQFDLGTSAVTRPLFRSRRPTTNPDRTFPALSNVLANVPNPWEPFVTLDRTLNFRVTVRDNRADGGGINDDVLRITVSGDPFVVTAPNVGNTAWTFGSTQTVTWDVGGGGVAPNVRILLSLDGGRTFPIVLAASTPNDGAEEVRIAGRLKDIRRLAGTTRARIKVEAVDNIFFDVSNADFRIAPAATLPS